RIIRKLSEASERLPSSLFITGVTGCEEWPSSGGGFANVYRGYYNGKPVALKLLRQFVRGEELRTIRLRFCREALVWQNLHHPHILPLIGIDRDTFSHSLCMVSPWMAYGTVLQYLNEHGRSNVDKLLFEVVQGLQYLHSCNIVHGDLRGANIFITHDSSACLGDFGLSRFSNGSWYSTRRGGNLRWMAPELIEPERFGPRFVRSTASDVYAFGCVCLELYTGRPPFSNILEDVAAMWQVCQGKRPERPTEQPMISDTLWQCVNECWEENPAARP
ncbi:kinase-like domain-containing protein, partial [Mycena rebaudengoi]